MVIDLSTINLPDKPANDITNHHVGRGVIAQLSKPGNDLVEKGFYAATREAELPVPGMELNILWKITDVTAEVEKAVAGAATLADGEAARRKQISVIQKREQDASGLNSQVVTLYGGGKYHLYQYRRFTDVRLVFAPERSIAFFGGDTDNFEYPRYNLDVTFFRLYENGKPYQAEHYLKWSSGAAEGDLTLVFGHPGSTRRELTAEDVRDLRDRGVPRNLARLWRSEVQMSTFAGVDAEHARVAAGQLFGIANSRKVTTGLMAGLADPAVMDKKLTDEAAFKAAIEKLADSGQREAALAAFGDIAKAVAVQAQHDTDAEGLPGGNLGTYGGAAVTMVRLAAELPKPSAERLPEYGDASLLGLYRRLYSPAPVYDFLERYRMEMGLLSAIQALGGDHPRVQALLGGKSPSARAAELVAGVTYKTPEARRKLVEGGAAALAEAIKVDPLLALVASQDEASRAVRKFREDNIDSVMNNAYTRLATARFAVYGDRVYPDATGTLRLAFGTLRGYEEDGKQIPAFTTVGGTFERYAEHKGQPGFDLPASWLKARDALGASTPFNFVCTVDAIGGNSGSPIVNRAGEFIGILFDGNRHGLARDIAYPGETRARELAVDCRGIVEALRVVYRADALLSELKGQ